MQIHNVQQGSPEWLALRANYFTASEAPAMMGASKYQTRTELLALKKTGIAPDVSSATQAIFDKGHATEAMARVILERRMGEDLFPVVATKGKLLASVDGMTMLEDTLFEHKLLNQSLVAQVQMQDLEPHYYWQLEQELLVTGAEKVIFVCSDGTEENFYQMEYTAIPGRAEQLISGWAQFEKDLEAFEAQAPTVAVVGKTLDQLPSLRIELNGMVTASNLAEFEGAALAVIDSVKQDLQTDQDFADAKKAVKWCSDVEAAVAQAKQQALSQTVSIDELFKSLDRISAHARSTRLNVDKQVKAQEQSIKVSISLKAGKELTDHIAGINQSLGRLTLPSIAADFAGAMKGKRTIASLNDAVSTELARAKIEASRIGDLMRINLESLRTLAKDHAFLFSDAQQITLKANDDLESLIKVRIAEHESQQQAKREADAKAEAEAKEKTEAEKLAAAQAQVAPVQPVAHQQPVAEASPAATPEPERAEPQVSKTIPVTMVSIAASELEALRKDSLMLQALMAAGVDSWEGYDDAMHMLEQEAA